MMEASIYNKSLSQRAKERLYEMWDAWQPDYEGWIEWSNTLYAPDAQMVAMEGDEPELFREYQAKMKPFRDGFDMAMGPIERCIVEDGVTAHTYKMHLTPKGEGKEKTITFPVTEFNHFADIPGYDHPMVVKLELTTISTL